MISALAQEHQLVQPNRFNTKVRLHDKLATFLGLPAGSTLTRTEITHSIAEYSRAHGLIDDTNDTIINADATLKELLGLPPEHYRLNFLRLQVYLRPLYTVE